MMHKTLKITAVALLMAGAGLTLAAGGDTPTPATPPADLPTASVPESAGVVLARIGRAAGLTVVTTSGAAASPVTPPKDPATAANVEQELADVVRQMPPGTSLVKMTLPAPPTGRTWNGDEVANFALAAFHLYGTAIFSAPVKPAPGAAVTATPRASAGLRLLAQTIPAEKAAQYTADLHLIPVYVVVNANNRAAQTSPSAIPGGGLPTNFPPNTTVTMENNPQAFQDFLSHLPPGPKRDDILMQASRDPNAVHIITDGDGHVSIEVSDERGGGKQNSKTHAPPVSPH